MYKTRIDQWGLDKKNKEFEMRAIVRKNKQRSDQGKRSVIRVRGRLRDFAEIIRYWDRKGVSIDEVIARCTGSPTPEAVDFSTPVSSPVSTPLVLAIPEQIFLCIRFYIKGSFESGNWVRTEPDAFCYSKKAGDVVSGHLGVFHTQSHLACALFQRNTTHEAGRALMIATARVKKILLEERPTSLHDLFDVLISFRDIGRYEIAVIILQHFCAMSQLLIGSEHPLSRVCGWLSRLFNSDFDNVVTNCMEVMIDQFESIVGSMHLSTLYFRLLQAQTKNGLGRASIQMLQRLLEECETVLHPFEPRTLWVRGYLADELREAGHYQKAKALYQQQLDNAQHATATNLSLQMVGDWEGLAVCQYALGEVDQAIATLWKAIDWRVSRFGFESSNSAYRLLTLEQWYNEQGRSDDAAYVREQRVKMLYSMDID